MKEIECNQELDFKEVRSIHRVHYILRLVIEEIIIVLFNS